MAFRLFITSAEGREFEALRSPYDQRSDMQRTIRVIITPTIFKDRTPEADIAFAEQVVTAPLGEVVHHASGVTFRTEETT